MRGIPPGRHGYGMLELFEEGPCCEEPACPVRTLWPRKGESRETFIARLKHEHRGALASQEAQP